LFFSAESPRRVTALYALEKGQFKGYYNFATGDLFRIERTNGVVKYYQNGNLLYTSLVPSTTALMVDVGTDALGTSIENIHTSFTSKPASTIITNYVRDASGNVMAIYRTPAAGAQIPVSGNLELTEVPIYGSSRLGQYLGGRKEGQRRLGQKNYELSNHLGNVLTVITDNINMSITDGVTATVVSATDYYPFGLEMKGRSYRKPDGVTAPVVSLDFSGTVDPFRSDQVAINIENGKLKVNAASLYNSTYMVLPTTMGHVYEVKFDVDLAGGGQITAFTSDRTNNLAALGVAANGTYSYKFTATGAEVVVIFENSDSGSPRDFYLDNVIIKDLSGGANAEDAYRYGFNGKEKDNSFASNNSYDYGFRIYNPRLAKFLSVDPLTNSYPWYTPYQFAGNKPIWAIDLDGLEELIQPLENREFLPVMKAPTKLDAASNAVNNVLIFFPKVGVEIVNDGIGLINYSYGVIKGTTPNVTGAELVARAENAVHDEIKRVSKMSGGEVLGELKEGFTNWNTYKDAAKFYLVTKLPLPKTQSASQELIVAKLAQTQEKSIAYRVIRAEEDISVGLSAKNPSASYTVEGHVLHGSRIETQYISMTKDLNVAKEWASKTGNRIVEIDLNQVKGEVIDLSNQVGRDAYLKGNTAKNFATKSSEVLLHGTVPTTAIKQIP
jgi:RHS repeat-associated protein